LLGTDSHVRVLRQDMRQCETTTLLLRTYVPWREMVPKLVYVRIKRN
jgi:hypothetical protein